MVSVCFELEGRNKRIEMRCHLMERIETVLERGIRSLGIDYVSDRFQLPMKQDELEGEASE